MLPIHPSRTARVLDPQDRIAEILFGLIMVLTFTGSLSAGEAGRADVRAMLIGALGCNLAWGVIDGMLYLMACLSERAQGDRMLRAAQGAADPEVAHRAIAQALPEPLASALGPADLEALRRALVPLPPPPSVRRLGRQDYRGAFAVFLLVFGSMFPVVIPFFFVHDPRPALRVSNAVAIVMLFLTGQAYARVANRHRGWMGLWMVLLGLVLVGMTIALGG